MAWKAAGLLALFLMAGAASLRAEFNLGLSRAPTFRRSEAEDMR